MFCNSLQNHEEEKYVKNPFFIKLEFIGSTYYMEINPVGKKKTFVVERCTRVGILFISIHKNNHFPAPHPLFVGHMLTRCATEFGVNVI